MQMYQETFEEDIFWQFHDELKSNGGFILKVLERSGDGKGRRYTITWIA